MCQQGWLHLTCTAPSFLCLKEQNHVFHLPVLQQHPWDSKKKKKKKVLRQKKLILCLFQVIRAPSLLEEGARSGSVLECCSFTCREFERSSH